jgi:sialic acid synthase SpsE
MHVSAASMRDFFRQFELTEAEHRAVAERARATGVEFMSTPFDEGAIDLLVRVGVAALKIASGDITHHRLIAAAARTGLPLILSTGMAEIDEVASAVTCAREAGARQLALLHCVSAYPVPAGEENLAAIATLAQTFSVPVGLSDHSTEPLSAAIAVCVGASLYERHVVLGPDDDAVDRDVSATPDELRHVVATAERVRRALGDGVKRCRDAERGNRRASRRGAYAARDLDPGRLVDEADVAMLRPLHAIEACEWRTLVGRRVVRHIPCGQAIEPGDLAAR